MSADILERAESKVPPTFEPPKPRGVGVRLWAAMWPKVLAVGIAVGVWQVVAWSGWKPDYLLPGPGPTFSRLWEAAADPDGRLWSSLATTLRRGIFGFMIALVIGSLLGIAVSRWRVLRAGIGSMITGLQTMPSVAWFPLALLLFGLTENAITFVIVLGAAPSIANGIISGIDEVPPNLLRAGHMLGARGVDQYRYVVLPAALPTYVSGLKQGWAFSWRSLLAGELLVSVPGVVALGSDMSNARNLGQADLVLALMIVILIIGMVVDAIFSSFTNRVRRTRGLTGLESVPS
ncbi:ABC transporter permease [Myroides odoratimimus subsp. xuanwuensis]